MALETPNAPIAITGMHRSGTSMITRALHDSGLHLIGAGAEELIDAAEDNPEGFWENKAVVACNDELLEATGGSWDNPPDLPPVAVDDPRVRHVAEASTAALMALGQHDHWGFKDPRTCLTAGYWLDLCPDLKFVICVRHPLEVALSLKRRNQNSYSLGLALWERYYSTVLDLVPADRRVVTHYDTFFVDSEGEIERLCAFAGLVGAPPRVRTDLRHHTISVNLADAGVSPSLRALYVDLCREAGVALAPEASSDEGRVRRLILDGAVAERHADQRQAAIDRLHEREVELRAERDAREVELKEQIRALERRITEVREAAAERYAALQADSVATMRELTEAVARTDARTRNMASRLETVVQATEVGPLRSVARKSARKAARGSRRYIIRPGRKVVDRGRQSATPVARLVVSRLPPPARIELRRARNLLRRGIAGPAPTAKAVGRKVEPQVREAARRLPPPARRALARNAARVRLARKNPTAAAKSAARRLPTPAQTYLGRSWRTLRRLADSGQPGRSEEPAPRSAPAPKGPALRQWKEAFEQMVSATVRPGERWLVITPGSPREVRDAAPSASGFPETRNGKPLPSDLAHIAQLEALRFRGHRYLVLPEGSRPWFRQQTELRDHVTGTYRTIVDREGAGAVFDLAESSAERVRSLAGEVNRLALGADQMPAVLDWTGLDAAGELPGFATFRSPDAVSLPYLDQSVDIVIVDGSHDRREARRVAAQAVIVVEEGSSGVVIVDVEVVSPPRVSGARADGAGATLGVASTPRVLVSSVTGSGDVWHAQLAERVAAAGADLRLGEIDAASAASIGRDYDVVVVVEPYVLPLPGAIESAAAQVVSDPSAAVSGKVLRPDGRLESAGGAVFFDRSVALVGWASPDVSAPWHDYVRPVCWAPGLVAAASSLWERTPGPAGLRGRAFVREWCAEIWARGGSVVYHPSVTAVRVTGEGGEATLPLRESAWQRVLDLRPARPAELGDGAWRWLLARDDVEACRG